MLTFNEFKNVITLITSKDEECKETGCQFLTQCLSLTFLRFSIGPAYIKFYTSDKTFAIDFLNNTCLMCDGHDGYNFYWWKEISLKELYNELFNGYCLN